MTSKNHVLLYQGKPTVPFEISNYCRFPLAALETLDCVGFWYVLKNPQLKKCAQSAGSFWLCVSSQRQWPGRVLQVPLVISAGLPCMCLWYRRGSGYNLKHDSASDLHCLIVSTRLIGAFGLWHQQVSQKGLSMTEGMISARGQLNCLVEPNWERVPGCSTTP